MVYSINNFLEIIQSEGCKFLHELEEDGVKVHVYLSRDGNRKVIIDISDEEVTKTVAISWLSGLGLLDCAQAMFP
jgi:hypothetical protein